MISIYLIGSLRNPEVPIIGNRLREAGYDVFDDWFAGGKIADDEWQAYETTRSRSYDVALRGYAARHVFEFDLHHLNRCQVGLLMMPAGKSGHLELGFMLGQGKRGYVLFDKEPDRWDVMYQFANGVAFNLDDLLKMMKEDETRTENLISIGEIERQERKRISDNFNNFRYKMNKDWHV